MKDDDERTTVVSVRITPALLRAVRVQARADGRSVSGEIVSIVSARLSAQAKRKIQPITGWLARADIPETHAEFRKARQAASSLLLGGTKRARRPSKVG
jgi:hypothetical protein